MGYIVRWHTEINGHHARGGYSVVQAVDKRDARKAARQQVITFPGEKLKIERVEA